MMAERNNLSVKAVDQRDKMVREEKIVHESQSLETCRSEDMMSMDLQEKS